VGKRGPKTIQINWDEFDKLLSYQCTQKEIAAFFNCSVDTLENRCIEDLGEKLSEVWDKRKLAGKLRLRKIQMQIAEGGSAPMAIFLGKALLGQTDQPPPKKEDESQVYTGMMPKTFQEFCTDAGYPEPFDAQVEMMKYGIMENEPRLLLGSRGYGKTDYITILGVAYDIYLYGVNSSTLIISKSATRNTSFINEIANALRANGVRLEKQNASTIRVKGMIGKDDSVEAVPLGSSLRTRHPKRVIMDDPATEEDHSEAKRAATKRKYDEAYKLCNNIIIIGQPAHKFDLYAHLRDKLKKMEVPHGTIPELDVDLEVMKIAGVDPASIEMSYHLRVPEDGSSIFAKIKEIDTLPVGDTVAFLDPSDGGDYTAITIIKGYLEGIAVYGKVYKRAWYHCLDDLLPILRAKNVKQLCFETNHTGTQPLEMLRKAYAEEGIGIVGKHSTSNKHSTIVAAGSMSHMIHLAKDSDKLYIDHVVKYDETAKYDDAPDSLARGLEWLGLIRGRK